MAQKPKIETPDAPQVPAEDQAAQATPQSETKVEAPTGPVVHTYEVVPELFFFRGWNRKGAKVEATEAEVRYHVQAGRLKKVS